MEEDKNVIDSLNNSTYDYKNLINVHNVDKNTINDGFKAALNTGNFGTKVISKDSNEYILHSKRLQTLQTISFLRRIKK